jgi:BON domain
MDDKTQSYTSRENLWDEQWPEEDLDESGHEHEIDELDERTAFPAEVGTNDPIQAIRDAEPYDPPSDPPVLPGGKYGVHVATGFGLSAEEEAFRDNETRDDEDIREEVVLTLHDDSLTSKYPLHVAVVNGVVRLTGRVPSEDDAEYAENLVSNVPGVVDVDEATTIDPNLE